MSIDGTCKFELQTIIGSILQTFINDTLGKIFPYNTSAFEEKLCSDESSQCIDKA